MLILTRKPGESLYIGDAVKITIVEIKGNQIRVGIDAPRELRIYREEIYLQIQAENTAAAGVGEQGLEALAQFSKFKGLTGSSGPKPTGGASRLSAPASVVSRSGSSLTTPMVESKGGESLPAVTSEKSSESRATMEPFDLAGTVAELERTGVMPAGLSGSGSTGLGGGFRTKRVEPKSVEVVSKKKRKREDSQAGEE